MTATRDEIHTVNFIDTEGKTKNLLLLPGAQDERYLLPLDFMPSQEYSPRWGYSKPFNSKLMELFKRDSKNYLDVIYGIKLLEPYFQKIPSQFKGQSIGWLGGLLNPIDSALYYYFTVKSRPKKIIEIGSGISTHFARRAIDDFKLDTVFTSVDPHPRAEIDKLCDKIIRSGLETMESLEPFYELEEGDVVFMDGSHRSFMNSDVTVFFTDIVPFLKPGVLIHLHDIHLPFDYSQYFACRYWNEQYMLALYLLAAEKDVRILFPGGFVDQDESLKSILKSQVPNVEGMQMSDFLGSGSFWFTKI